MKDFANWRVADQKTREILRRCRDAVYGVAPDATLVLFGSHSRGTAGPESDFDFLILVDDPTETLEDQIRDAIFPVEIETGAVFSLCIESKTKWDSALYQTMPFVRAVEAEGIAL